MKKIILLSLLLLSSAAYLAAVASPLDGAQWISAPNGAANAAMPIFRKVVTVENKTVKKATLYASALGVYDILLKGIALTPESELKPEWTDYRKEVQYQKFCLDGVPERVYHDGLTIAAQVSNGWWAGPISRGIYGKDVQKAFICRLVLEYADGTTAECVTDTTWECTTDGPLMLGDIYNGETYDARRASLAECLAGDGGFLWRRACVNTDAKGRLIAETAPPVRVRDRKLWRSPQSITIYKGSVSTGTTHGSINVVDTLAPPFFSKPLRLKAGETLLVDFGQNMVGWIDMAAQGDRGTVMTWRFGEMLNFNGDEGRLDKGPGGSLWTYNLRTARATFEYVMRGGGVERYHPRHTFFGFRYAELTATADVTLDSLVAQVVGTDLTEWGSFECSNTDINRLYSNTWWSQRGNFLSIPTDCPQRDERLGWTGDTHIFSLTALYNSDAAAFYRKWMGDMRASQRADGAYPETAPFCNMWGYGTSAWGDAGIIVPWNVYVMTGDESIIRENWNSMTRWIDFCKAQKEGPWTHIGAEPKTGDWLAYKLVEGRYVSYAYFAHSAMLMHKMASVLGRTAEAGEYLRLWREIKDEFQRRYVTDGEINTGRDTQTAYLLALHFNLLDEGQRPKAMEALRRNIEDNGYKLSTGFVGTGILMQTLTECGMTDMAYRLLLQRENPSWLYSIDQGATTIWERWDSYTRERGFHKHPWNMNSFNHYSYGAVVEWFYSTILGIRADENSPGFRHFYLAPQPGGGMTFARGGTMTPYGPVSAEWQKRKKGGYDYTVVVPKGTTATFQYGAEKRLLKSGRHKIRLQ
ncbi:MAG: family 78 glycoside hydrolase catalytic domain [Prevotellaceae bacterium]|nr:family 78 glycoside hydrolase catalytic domain [Prevotellaceae bacterium]